MNTKLVVILVVIAGLFGFVVGKGRYREPYQPNQVLVFPSQATDATVIVMDNDVPSITQDE